MTWIQVHGGAAFDLGAPVPEQVERAHIVWSLGSIQRWTGHANRECSVAEHTVITAAIMQVLARNSDVEDHAAVRAALAHDMHEAYVGDVASPLKQLLEQRAPGVWASIVDPIQAAIDSHFGVEVTPEIRRLVKLADEMALQVDRESILSPSQRPWSWDPPRPPLPIGPQFFDATSARMVLDLWLDAYGFGP